MEMMFHVAYKYMAVLVSSSADGYHIISRFNEIFFNTMRDMFIPTPSITLTAKGLMLSVGFVPAEKTLISVLND